MDMEWGGNGGRRTKEGRMMGVGRKRGDEIGNLPIGTEESFARCNPSSA